MDIKLWHEPGCIHEILSTIPDSPDFILLNDLKETRCPEISGLSSVTIPFGIIMHDIHYKVENRKRFILENNVQYIFSIYRDAFYRRFPEYKQRMRWLPHFVNTELFKDYGQPKEIDWLMMGKMASYYPLREKMYRMMRDKAGFVYHGHPGYRNIREKEEIFVGEKYAKEINRAKMFLTCDSRLHYPIIKYFEVTASKTLLLAPASKELRDLGFRPGIHYVAINSKNFIEKAEYYLTHEKERHQITENGYQMVRKKHSAPVRAQQLVEEIEKIIDQHSK